MADKAKGKEVMTTVKTVRPRTPSLSVAPPTPHPNDIASADAAMAPKNVPPSPSLLPSTLVGGVKTTSMTNVAEPLRLKPHQVIFDQQYGQCRLREFSNCIVEGATVLAAQPSQAFTAVLAAQHIIETLSLPLVAVISTPRMVPKCIISDGIPTSPIRIHGDKRLVVVLSETKSGIDDVSFDLAQLILDFAKRHRAGMMLLVEGLPVAKESEEPVIRKEKDENGEETIVPELDITSSSKEPAKYLGTDERFLALMEAEELEQVSDGFVVGVTGAILMEILMESTPFGCLLVPAQSLYPDVASAVRAIKLISKYLEIDIPTVAMEVRSKIIVDGIMELLKAIQSTIKSEKEQPPPLFYS
jgi:predicted ATP-grasp superfamily ATP-dependent carboligase